MQDDNVLEWSEDKHFYRTEQGWFWIDETGEADGPYPTFQDVVNLADLYSLKVLGTGRLMPTALERLFIVYGGIYEDSSYKKLVSNIVAEGPYTWAEAHAAWKKHSFSNVDDCNAKYRIENLYEMFHPNCFEL